MFRRQVLMAAVLAVGGLLGWLAASGQLSLSRPAFASTDAAPPTPAASANPIPSCCDADANPAVALINAHNQNVSANLQKDGK